MAWPPFRSPAISKFGARSELPINVRIELYCERPLSATVVCARGPYLTMANLQWEVDAVIGVAPCCAGNGVCLCSIIQAGSGPCTCSSSASWSIPVSSSEAQFIVNLSPCVWRPSVGVSCRDPVLCAGWVCVVLSFGLVGGPSTVRATRLWGILRSVISAPVTPWGTGAPCTHLSH